MSIDVRRQYFYQSVWTCIKVLSEHILWTECYYFELIFSVFYALSISPTYSMSLVLSFPLNLCLVFYFRIASARFENLYSRHQLQTDKP